MRERESEREHEQAWGQGEGETDAPLCKESDVGFDVGLHPRVLGSRPELKAETRPTEPPRRPRKFI